MNNLVFLLEDSFYSTVDVALKRKGFRFIRKFDCWCFPEDNHPEVKEMDRLLADCFKTWYSNECSPLKNRLMKLEESGIKEMKSIYDNEQSSNLPAYSTHIYHYVAQSGESKPVIPPDDDIPEEDIPEDTSENSRKELQKLIDRQIISKRDASWLYMKIYDQELAFKESRTGWSIEDRLKQFSDEEKEIYDAVYGDNI